jgi:hypothetical protein
LFLHHRSSSSSSTSSSSSSSSSSTSSSSSSSRERKRKEKKRKKKKKLKKKMKKKANREKSNLAGPSPASTSGSVQDGNRYYSRPRKVLISIIHIEFFLLSSYFLCTRKKGMLTSRQEVIP